MTSMSGVLYRVDRRSPDEDRVEKPPDIIEVVGDIAVPALVETPGFCGALLFAHLESGRLISETVWRDPAARTAGPDVAAIIRTEVPDEAASEIRGRAGAGAVASRPASPGLRVPAAAPRCPGRWPSRTVSQ